MSITSTISERPYTLMGTSAQRDPKPYPFFLSVVLLRRGGKQFYPSLIEDLAQKGVGEIILVESLESSSDMESLIHSFPRLRCLLVQEPLTVGEKINLAVEEALGDWVLVQWTDMAWGDMPSSSRMWQEVSNRKEAVLVPELSNRFGEGVPSRFGPSLLKKEFKPLPIGQGEEDKDSIYPFDFVGLLNKAKFRALGGYDGDNPSPYWQCMDFGLRSHLWGEHFYALPGFRMKYLSDLSATDSSYDDGYRRFFLRNLMVRNTGDSGEIPLGRFLSYYFRAGQTLSKAWKEFTLAKDWVKTNRYRFRLDARSLVELWGDV
jgi:hypothetical protein